jgi:S-DNA-T family DNA segregation ATPase FtsK/SpoIIIE
VIGMGADGPFSVDLCRDGPHALVAGTTGAGKSELLQTLVASLAVANRPDEMSFLLVDYKGGAAFRDCQRLPHTVGMVTDLDGHLTQRALRSLDAEIKRRERLLHASRCSDIGGYQRAGCPSGPMARLLIVIDEFASLAQELPDFVTGLVDVARRGRSLGVHLVLATQRPAGVVSAEIRANANLRIALRVTDPMDSQDVIESRHAALISATTPGRAYVRTGTASVRHFQSAMVGCHEQRPGAAADMPPVPWMELGATPPAEPSRTGEVTGDGPTDLARLVEAVRGATDLLGVTPPPSPWLPPLPDRVVVDELPGPPHGSPRLPVGLTDVPARQARGTLVIDLADGGHWLVAGGPRSGRSTLLRLIAGVVARDWDVADVHVYGLDCASGALLPVAALPHCGAIADRGQPGRGDRIISRLAAEVRRRQALLGRPGFASVAEQRAAVGGNDRLPWLLLLVDGWEGFLATYETVDHGRPVDDLLRLLRDGQAAGLRAIVTGDRSLLTGRVGSLCSGRLILRLADPADFALAGVPAREVPRTMPPGRALLPDADGVREAQLALVAPDPAGPAQLAELRRLAERAREHTGDLPRGRRPFRVEPLPEQLQLAEVLPRAQRVAAHRGPLWTLVGIGGDELDPVGFDPADVGPWFVVAGPPGSGRSATLVSMARWHAARETPLALVTARRSRLRDVGLRPGRVDHFGADDAGRLTAFLDSRADRPLAVLVDDAEDLLDSPVETALLAQPHDGHIVIVAGSTDGPGSTYHGLTVAARKSRCGLVLGPFGPLDGELLGAKLPWLGDTRPGRGVLAVRGLAMPVQVPLS